MAAVIAASSLPSEGMYHSTSYGITCNSIKSPIDGRMANDLASNRCKSPFFGSSHLLWLSMGRDLCLSKVRVAADYSDSVPDSSSYMSKQGYHPLEELKDSDDTRPTRLSSAEIAKTVVEANKNALLVFPGTVHCEPHEQISWAEFQYLIDEFGDIYFEIFDDANILQDPGASNLVNALFGMDIPAYDNRTGGEYDSLNSVNNDEFPSDDEYLEVLESEESNIPGNWQLPDTSSLVHPIYFSKFLTKTVNMDCNERMNHPSNGVSVLGYLRPAYADEESYVRMVYPIEDADRYSSDSKDGKGVRSNRISDQRCPGMTLYRLEIVKIKLYSIYGCQACISKVPEINFEEFQDAEPDILVHSASVIVEDFKDECDALEALCKKKGLDVEGACLIGVDSLGMDVRVFSGAEAKTHRFPFKVLATSEVVAKKQIRQLLFPPSRRKKYMKSKSWRKA
ncbi:hypothetical protein TanjilG_29603 [Lupinus angustifolius]|uniref:Uncharacterized protein n=1 Tax=Lupinus angustifolius TaxID=3871 RepID=A0A4P1R5S2_LUPAN|nr:hypothetical protein TanjilG_29603 [Lupinus angustifolius]